MHAAAAEETGPLGSASAGTSSEGEADENADAAPAPAAGPRVAGRTPGPLTLHQVYALLREVDVHLVAALDDRDLDVLLDEVDGRYENSIATLKQMQLRKLVDNYGPQRGAEVFDAAWAEMQRTSAELRKTRDNYMRDELRRACEEGFHANNRAPEIDAVGGGVTGARRRWEKGSTATAAAGEGEGPRESRRCNGRELVLRRINSS